MQTAKKSAAAIKSRITQYLFAFVMRVARSGLRFMRADWLAPARDTPSQAAETCVQTQARPVKRLAMGQLRRRRGMLLPEILAVAEKRRSCPSIPHFAGLQMHPCKPALPWVTSFPPLSQSIQIEE
jgi:hypothetical protein